jgi:hypothetical protein
VGWLIGYCSIYMTMRNRRGCNAIFPNATVEKLEGTVLINPWCIVEVKPLVSWERSNVRVGCDLTTALGVVRSR